MSDQIKSLEEGLEFQPNLDEFKKTLGITPRKYWQMVAREKLWSEQNAWKLPELQGSDGVVLTKDPTHEDRLTALEQRIQRQAELLEQMERALNELTEMLRPSPDPTDQIQKLHKQIIDQYPVEHGQLYQAVDSDGTVCRYSQEPYLGIAQGVWNYNGPLWTVDDVQLNGINWRETLIKL